MTRIVHTEPANWPSRRADRFASRIVNERADGCQLALLGLPDDTGVRLNGGRPGAERGPSAFRAALASYGTAWDNETHAELSVKIFDAGDVIPAAGDGEEALLATHTRIERSVTALHELGLTPVCIGGGHDLSLPSIRALSRFLAQPVGGINFDAHLDVRARVGSGMPFRRLIEAGCLDPRRFVEFGVGRFVNDPSDVTWLEERGGTLVGVERVLREGVGFATVAPIAYANGNGFLSVDLDGVDSSQMAAVSALNPCGVPVHLLTALVESAGADPRVRHFDIMELAPELDPGGRGARVAAHVFLSFVAGFARRAT